MVRTVVGAMLAGLLAASSCLRTEEPLDAAPEAPGVTDESSEALASASLVRAPRATVTLDPAATGREARVHAALVRAELALERGDYLAVEVALDEAAALDPDHEGIAPLRWEATAQQAARTRMLRPRARTVSY